MAIYCNEKQIYIYLYIQYTCVVDFIIISVLLLEYIQQLKAYKVQIIGAGQQ